MSKSALIVGIDYYSNPKYKNLSFCKTDANNINKLLMNNGDDESTPNFETIYKVATSKDTVINAVSLKEDIKQLFASKHNETVLFYFSGHGSISASNEGYITTSDATSMNNGVSMVDILKFANKSPVRNKIIILDTCHSGSIGTHPTNTKLSVIGEGVTILTASSLEQVAYERVFTDLLIDALDGSAASIIGQITPGSIYSYIDKSLGNFEQRPIFKTNTSAFVEIRKIKPFVKINELKQIVKIFQYASTIYPLDQTYESDKMVPPEYKDKKKCILKNHVIFRILQKFNSARLVVPIDEDHMYYAAMNETGCKLTRTGMHYWDLVNRNKI